MGQADGMGGQVSRMTKNTLRRTIRPICATRDKSDDVTIRLWGLTAGQSRAICRREPALRRPRQRPAAGLRSAGRRRVPQTRRAGVIPLRQSLSPITAY